MAMWSFYNVPIKKKKNIQFQKLILTTLSRDSKFVNMQETNKQKVTDYMYSKADMEQ